MQKLLLLSLLISFWGCRIDVYLPPAPVKSTPATLTPVQTTPNQPNTFTPSSTNPLGRYLVTAYIVEGDTLFSTRRTSGGYMPGINKVDINNFAIVLGKGKDQYSTLTYSYYHNRSGAQPTFVSNVVVSVLSDYYYRFTPQNASSLTSYEYKLQRVNLQLYQRTVGGGIFIPLAGSSAPLDQMTNKEVIIVASPQQ